jgi:hypothetical protein
MLIQLLTPTDSRRPKSSSAFLMCFAAAHIPACAKRGTPSGRAIPRARSRRTVGATCALMSTGSASPSVMKSSIDRDPRMETTRAALSVGIAREGVGVGWEWRATVESVRASDHSCGHKGERFATHRAAPCQQRQTTASAAASLNVLHGARPFDETVQQCPAAEAEAEDAHRIQE